MLLSFISSFLAVASALSADRPLPMPSAYLANVSNVLEAASTVTTARYPDADLVLLEDSIHTLYEADGTNCMWDDEWIKILTEKGRRESTTVSLDVSLRYGDAAIECVEIVGTNGVIRTVDFHKTIKMATDNSSTQSNIYDPLDKCLTCAVPGLQVGEIRHVRFCTRTRKPRMKGTWANHQLFEFTAPIQHTRFTVDQPNANPIRHAVIRHALSNTVTRLPDRPLPNGRTLLSWQVHDVPQAFPEPDMPPIAGELQGLYLSTAKDWPTVSRWYWQLCVPHLLAGTANLTNTVCQIVAAHKGEESRLRALFRFVSQQVRYMGITDETEAPGYEPHDVGLTFEKRYGVCRDKAALLVAMLRIAGFDAYPVLIHAGKRMDEEAPMPYFNHAIVGVRVKGQKDWTLMDPTDEAARDLMPAYLSDCSYLVATPTGEALRLSPVTAVEQNMLRADSEGTLNADGSALLTVHLQFGGINDTAFRHYFLNKTEDLRRQTIANFMRAVSSGAELLSYDLQPVDLSDTEVPLSLKAIIRFPDVILQGNTSAVLSPPLITRAFSVVNALLDDNTSLVKRRFPLVFDTTAGTDESLTLKLGESVGPLSTLPPQVEVGAGTDYHFTYSTAVSNGVFYAKRRKTIEALRFEVPAYNRLRDDIKIVEADMRTKPVFDLPSNSNANIYWILNRAEVFLTSPHNWVVTNTIEKEVLTYKGKKASAELSISYHPLVETVTLVSATVSNKNGKVHSVTPKETHLLDCNWAAKAPRYPAGKRLVVNLPSVEIGSVIRYVVAHQITNAPLAYSGLELFDSTEPIGCKTLKITVPDNMPFKYRTTCFDTPECLALEDHVGNCRRFAWRVKDPKCLPRESAQAPSLCWRRTLFVTTADWPEHRTNLSRNLAAAREAGSALAREQAQKIVRDCESPEEKVIALRRYLAHHIRVVGPSNFGLPFDVAFFPPDRVLTDAYASFVDRQNLFFTMLSEVGFSCTFLLGAGDATGLPDITRRYVQEYPLPDFFDDLIIRATYGDKVFYLMDENEYTPVNCCAQEGDSYLNLDTGTFGRIAQTQEETPCWWRPWTWWTDPAPLPDADPAVWTDCSCNFLRLTLREDGGADIDTTNIIWGASVGDFRKRYNEMLPENRSRHFQSLLGQLAESASATRDLETDTEGDPATLSFAAFIPSYASTENQKLTLAVPGLTARLVRLDALNRLSPIVIPGKTDDITVREIVFPKGYTRIEYLPEPYELCHPQTGETWMIFMVDTRIENDRLIVRLVLREFPRLCAILGPEYAPFIQEWNRKLLSRERFTLIVGKAK